MQKPQRYHNTLLELINKFGKVARNKVKTRKSIALLCTNNEPSKGNYDENFIYNSINKIL